MAILRWKDIYTYIYTHTYSHTYIYVVKKTGDVPSWLLPIRQRLTPCLTCWALFGSLVPAMFNRTPCAQVHELPWGHWRIGNNREGTLPVFLTTYIYPSGYRRLNMSLGRHKKMTTSYAQTRRRHNVWKKMSDLRSLEDVWFTMSSGRLVYDVLKTYGLRCLEDVQFKTSWRCLIYDVLKTSNLWRLEDVCKTTSV